MFLSRQRRGSSHVSGLVSVSVSIFVVDDDDFVVVVVVDDDIVVVVVVDDDFGNVTCIKIACDSALGPSKLIARRARF